jgi:hypothetical protein
MRPTREARIEPDVTETENDVSYRKIVLWVAVGLAIVAGVVSYFKYAKLLGATAGLTRPDPLHRPTT